MEEEGESPEIEKKQVKFEMPELKIKEIREKVGKCTPNEHGTPNGQKAKSVKKSCLVTVG